ncbi:MAG: non-heme iron oxygenase ferredoxin subunit [bacterium]|nr:non-heme iron oxygenase ferredoxin subunit [bacterium]
MSDRTIMWYPVAQLDELNQIQPKRVEADGEPFVLFRDGETVYCLRDVCSHAEVPLSGGVYDRRSKQVTCPQHGARFDIISGKALSMPAVTPVQAVPVQIVNGVIEIQVDDF